jgi:hypothetical protein
MKTIFRNVYYFSKLINVINVEMITLRVNILIKLLLSQSITNVSSTVTTFYTKEVFSLTPDQIHTVISYNFKGGFSLDLYLHKLKLFKTNN